MNIEKITNRIERLEELNEEKTKWGGMVVLNMVRLPGESKEEHEKRIFTHKKGDIIQINVVSRLFRYDGESDTDFQERVEKFHNNNPYFKIILELRPLRGESEPDYRQQVQDYYKRFSHARISVDDFNSERYRRLSQNNSEINI